MCVCVCVCVCAASPEGAFSDWPQSEPFSTTYPKRWHMDYWQLLPPKYIYIYIYEQNKNPTTKKRAPNKKKAPSQPTHPTQPLSTQLPTPHGLLHVPHLGLEDGHHVRRPEDRRQLRPAPAPAVVQAPQVLRPATLVSVAVCSPAKSLTRSGLLDSTIRWQKV